MRVRASELIANGICNVSLTYGTQKTGYVVPVPGREVKFPEDELNDSEITYYLRENGDLLGDPNYLLSGEINDGEVILNVGKRYTHKNEAVSEAKAKKTYEIYDLKNEIKIYL
jgi:hypothetical protein